MSRVFFILLHRFILRELLKNRVRSLLTVLGIALGVAVMLAINLANTTALNKFQESLDLISGKTTLSLKARTDADFDQAALARMSMLWEQGIKFTPVIEQLAVSAAAPHEVIQVLGLDMLADRDFRSQSLSSAKSSDYSGFDIFRLRHAYVGSSLASKYGLKSGDSFELLINDRQEKIIVQAVLADEGVGRVFSGNVIVMDIGCAQELFSMKERISRVDMICPEEKIAYISSALEKVLPSGLVVERPSRRGAQVEKMLRSFQYNLTALSLIALLVGMFLIYNTMSIGIIRRRWQIGTLRALGVSGPMIFRLFCCEALILGSCGAALGVLTGWGFARYALVAVSRTVQSHYADLPPSELVWQPQIFVLAFGLGLFLTVLAAMGPAQEAVAIPPAEAARRASYEMKILGLAPRLALLGLLLLFLSVLAAFQPAIAGFPFFGYAAAALAVFGTAALTPICLDSSLKALARFLAGFLGMEARLAALSLHGALGRTSVTVASLMVGISMMVSLAVMIGSFRHTVITWVGQTLKADLWLEPASRAASRRAGNLSYELVERIRQIKEIAAVDAFIEFPIEYENEPCNLGAGELDVMEKFGNLMFVNGEQSSKVLSRIRGKDSVIISESFALKHHKRSGDTLFLDSLSGKFPVKVEGIYYDYASDTGFIVLPRESFLKHFEERPATTLAIFLKSGVSAEAVRQSIFAAMPANGRLNIRTNKELKEEVLRVFDNTFSITYALHAISIVVAILGVMNALFALTMESRKDLGIIKYLGASELQMKKLVLIQAGILGTLGNAGGLLVGSVLSLLLIHVINKQSFGWTIQLDLPFDFLLESFALIFFCSLLAGVIPARLAAKTPAPEVVRSE
ncbi:MAG: ABC transporter permease [Candidatus Obscuribacterales bacterium]|nr:ABC transporter permease [Candidatus Obscuribacterales bacterium]